MIKVYVNYRKEATIFLPTKEAFDRLVDVACKTYNCGIYRRWENDGMTYFDCGRSVYAVKSEELLQ